MHRAIGLKKNLLHQKGDSKRMKTMLAGISHIGDCKTQISRFSFKTILDLEDLGRILTIIA